MRSLTLPLNTLFRAAGDRSIAVLVYHRVLPAPDPLRASEPDLEQFRREMRVLADCFRPLSLADAVAALSTDDFPPGGVCVTFDDGYEDNLRLALPILREFGIPATVFVASGFLDGGVMFNDCVIDAVAASVKEELVLEALGSRRWPLTTLGQRRQCIDDVIDGIKYEPPTVREQVLDELRHRTGVAPASRMLSLTQLRELGDAGVEIGAHTRSHPILRTLPDAAASEEIAGSRVELERALGRSVRYFAYPNGKHGVDYDERHMAMVAEAGFEAAFTTEAGVVRAGADCCRLPRFRPWDRSYLRFWARIWQARLRGPA